MVGSHLDSVPAGGNYDGPLGTLGALEGVLTLKEAGIRPRHPVDVVVFVNEEGGKTGSRVMAGEFQSRELELETASGFTIGEGIRRLGGDPERLSEARTPPGAVAGFLELHVEQGAVLEGMGTPIGVVEGIVGIRRWNAVVRGAANHAGTTPMDQRKDALLSAARLIEAVNRVGDLDPRKPGGHGGPDPGKPWGPECHSWGGDPEYRDSGPGDGQDPGGYRRDWQGSEYHCRREGTSIELEEFYLSGAAPTDERFRSWVESAAEELGLDNHRMPSGAGHDAQAVAHFAPIGMVFIPSVGGLSHHPDEYSRPEDIEAGVNVLLGALLRADAGLD